MLAAPLPGMLQWQSMIVKRMLMRPHPVVETTHRCSHGRCEEADVDEVRPIGGKPSTDALLSAESAHLLLAIALLQVT